MVGSISDARKGQSLIDYEVIDSHMHLCRSVQQEQIVFPKPGVPDRWRWGAPDVIGNFMDRVGMSHVVTLNIMSTRAMTQARLSRSNLVPGSDQYLRLNETIREEMREKVRVFNRWACDIQRMDHRIAPCVYADPVLFGHESVVGEVEEGIADGAKGVKMHPYISEFSPDDRQLWPLFDRIQELGVPIVFDTGGREENVPHLGRPGLFRDMLRGFPSLIVVMAHLASAYWDERVRLAQEFPNVMFDTSGGFSTHDKLGRGGRQALCEEDAVRVIREIGAERIMFGSDGPVYDPIEQLIQIARLPLQESERRAILADNAKRIFDLSE